MQIRIRHSVYAYAIVLCVMGVLVSQNCFAGRKASKKITCTVKAFLDNWLVKRDPDSAMKYVSYSPVLGICARPEPLVGKSEISATEYRTAIEWILSQFLNLCPRGDSLEKIIEPTKITPPEEKNIAQGEPFDLYSLRHIYHTATFICKFDHNPSFRKIFDSPDVWYLNFRLKGRVELSWTFVWKYEDNEWRIISLGPVDD